MTEKASEKTCYLGRSCGVLYNAQLILHCYQNLRNIINTSLIKVPENITSHIVSNTLLRQQQLEITGKFLPTDSRYKEVIIKLISKTYFFNFKFPKNTEIARLYFFTSPGKKNSYIIQT